MRRREWMKLAAGAAVAPSFGWADSHGIPDHPSKLEFPPLSYDPPDPAGLRRELAGGAVGYFVEDHQFPLVNVSVIIRTGSYLLGNDATGLASMTGSQIRAGGTKEMSARDFDEEAAFLATEVSSNIGGTSGGASMNCLKQNLDASLKLLFDMLKNPGFDPDRLELARAQTLQGLERRNDETAGIYRREWSRLLRGDHFSARQSTKATVEAISRETMMEFHQSYYHPASMIFAVSGDFDTDDMVKRLSEALSSGWPGSKPEVPPVPGPTHQPKPGVYTVNKEDVNQSRIGLGHIGIKRDHPDHIAVQMMNELLGGGGFTSRIMSRVRSDEGLAYSAGSRYQLGTYYPGVFRAAFQSKNESCAQATAIVLEEIERMREEKASEEELQTAKNYQIEIFPRFFATAGQVAGTFARDEFTGREKDYWKKYRGRVADVSVDDVLRVAQKHIRPEEFVILGVGNVPMILAGDPDKPEYKFSQFATGGKVHRIPLPDPLTMEYPEGG